MSGRHGHRKKSKPKPKNAASAARKNMQTTTKVGEAKPEEALDPIEHNLPKAITGLLRTIRKPDPFDVALWGLLAAISVTVIYYFQLRVMSDQLAVMNGQLDQMQLDQRPWIKIMVDPSNMHVGSANIVMMHFINTGKNPALNPDADVVVKTLEFGDDFDADHPYVVKGNNTNEGETNMHTGVVFPDPHGIDYMINRLKRLPLENLTIIPPQVEPISEGEMDEYTANKLFFIIIAKITYSDSAGDQHWTHFCNYLANDPRLMVGQPAAEKCVAYNAVDSKRKGQKTN